MSLRSWHLFLLLVVLSWLPVPASLAADRCEPWVAQVVSVEGQVEAKRAGQVRWEPVLPGEFFCAEDSLQAEAFSRAAILLRNETMLRLDQRTAVTFSAMVAEEPSWLDLLKGAVHFISHYPRALRVTTPFVNAGIEGTEFVIRVGSDQSALWVFEGRVLASNEAGSLALVSGEAAIAKGGKAPVRHVVIRPRDAVQWALYYPPLLDYRAAVPAGSAVVAIQQALDRYRAGDLPGAIAQLNKAPAGLRDAQYFTLRAGLLLSVGRVDEARSDLEQALNLDPRNGTAVALQSVMAVVQGEKDKALDLARQAVGLEPRSPVPHIALSYTQQASFEIEKALESVQEAVSFAPEDALAWARLAELWLSLGNLDRTLQAAQEAVARHPDLARTQTVLGFAHLTRIEIPKAKSAFERAIELDQADPLPRLGLGLAKIRESELAEGRQEIEIAASLDPNSSLIRSYLAKAYFEEKRDPLSASQLEIAKELDTRDPTPWFYDAIREQSVNQPVEAFHNLQKAIELNDNRAVYRSRFLLDEDLAARSATLGRLYNELGFESLGLIEGWKSLNTDPSNYSAHRLLADTYFASPRRGIARVSELLQAQLLQPINITPVQPQLAESDLFLLGGLGPAEPALNEFNPLFFRNRFSLLASGMVGSNNTWGDEIVQSGIWDRLSYSVGQFHYETDGFRSNNDFQQDIYNLFVQGALSPSSSVQAELRHTELEEGDRGLNFFPEDFDANLRQDRKTETARLGFRYAPSPNADVIASFIYKNVKGSLQTANPIADFSAKLDEEAYLVEGQHLVRLGELNIVSGAGHFSTLDREQEIVTNFLKPFPRTVLVETEAGIRHTNLYAYSYLNYWQNLTLTLGASANFFKGTLVERNQFNPKVGLIWTPFPGTTLRAAAFRVLEPGLSIGQTIEPTHVVGFNQFFGTTFEQDIENSNRQGLDVWRYGIAVDQKFSSSLYAGAEFSKRDLRIPGTADGDSVVEDWNDYLGRAYLYWAPHPWLAASAEYQFERSEQGRLLAIATKIQELETYRVPIGINFFHPSGFSVEAKATFIDQSGLFFSTFPNRPGADQFWVIDTAMRYRLPRRLGLVTLGVSNLLNERFNFREIDPTIPTVQHDRVIFGQVTLVF